MLSIIISTHKPENFEKVSRNIHLTVGTDFEIIKIENAGIISLTAAYNLGAAKALYENLLFVHDDIEFKTHKWGPILLAHLEKENTGVIGIAGSNYVPKAPCGWFNKGINDFAGEKFNQTACNATVLDGVFLAIQNKKFQVVKFNENVKGFHGYDTDFSLRASRFFQNMKINNIELEHFSAGKPNKEYLDNNIQIREANKLTNTKINNILEREAFTSFIKSFFKYKKINRYNVLFTLKFLPWKLKIQDFLQIAKIYLRIIKNARAINKSTENN